MESPRDGCPRRFFFAAPGAAAGGSARVERSILWDGAVVEAGTRVSGAIVVTGAVVRPGEKADGVIVMPAEALGGQPEAGCRVERRGDMAWVELR